MRLFARFLVVLAACAQPTALGYRLASVARFGSGHAPDSVEDLYGTRDDGGGEGPDAGGRRHQHRTAVDGRTHPGEAAVQRYVDRQLEKVEERIGRRIDEQSRKLNQSIAVLYLEKVVDYLSEEMQLNRELLTERRDDSQRRVELLQATVEQQRSKLERWAQTVSQLSASVGNLTSRLQDHLDEVAEQLSDAGGRERVDGKPRDLNGDDDDDEEMSQNSGPSSFDCEDAYESKRLLHVPGFQYAKIKPRDSGNAFKTACYVTNTTSWTVIQRRLDGSVDFYRNWSDYRAGFGQAEGEFWLGNERIHQLTNQGDYRLRVEMVTWDNQAHWAEYTHFRIAPESDKYRLQVAGFIPGGDAGDSLTSAWENDHNGQPFSTYDSDNDARFYDNCAQHYRGAWWFRSCFQSHLNGVYYQRGSHSNFFVRNGIQWNTIHPHSSLRHVAMMVRRNAPVPPARELTNDVE